MNDDIKNVQVTAATRRDPDLGGSLGIPTVTLVFPGFGEQVANEVATGMGEVDLDTGQALSPKELRTDPRVCGCGGADTGLVQHRPQSVRGRKCGKNATFDPERREAMMVLFDGAGQPKCQLADCVGGEHPHQPISAGSSEHLRGDDEHEHGTTDRAGDQRRSHHASGFVAAPSSQRMSDSSLWVPVDPTCLCGAVGPFLMT